MNAPSVTVVLPPPDPAEVKDLATLIVGATTEARLRALCHAISSLAAAGEHGDSFAAAEILHIKELLRGRLGGKVAR